MRIADLYAGQSTVYSFEFFPPKTEKGVRSLFRALDELLQLEPDFVSVTYPLDRVRRPLTVDIVTRIKRETGLEAMAHLTCVDVSRAEINAVLEELVRNGIENVLALRGDPPTDGEISVPRNEWFAHASDLAAHVRASFPLCIGGAAHPETHPEAASPADDLKHLKRKVEAGCEFLITNLYFANEDYFDFLDRARAIGIDVPIVPGIMPVTSVSGIKRMCELNGSQIPAPFLAELEAAADDDGAVTEIGVRYAKTQCEELIDKGVPGIHFYTLNRSTATREVLTQLRRRR